MKVTMIGVDLAKSILQVCGVNQAGTQVFNKTTRKKKLVEFLMVNHPGVTVAMEACSGSNPLGRELQSLGFKVLLIPPNHVKPFVKGNKNDRNDAFAITEAARRPNMQFVQPKTLEQTDLVQVHRLRDRRVRHRTTLTNQLRGFLREYGIDIPEGLGRLREAVLACIEPEDERLTVAAKALFEEIYFEWQALNERIKKLDDEIIRMAKNNKGLEKLMTLKGVGPVIASAFRAAVGDGSSYSNGRHCAACIGLVPKEHSSGGKQKLGGITKRGNSHLRRLLVQGAMSILQHADNSTDKLSCWARQLRARRGPQIAAVAVANKMARILWAMSYNQTTYRGAVAEVSEQQ